MLFFQKDVLKINRRIAARVPITKVMETLKITSFLRELDTSSVWVMLQRSCSDGYSSLFH